MAKSPEIITLGCRLNASESEAMAALARDSDDGRELVVINSCAVTNDAVAETRRTIRRARRERPDAHLVVTGCAAQIDPTSFAAMEEVDQVMGNHAKLLPQSYSTEALMRPKTDQLDDIMDVRDTAPQFFGSANQMGKAQNRTRAFLQVQNGCDHRCTFCIIPYGRGNSRSVPAGEVVRLAQSLRAQGYHEIVLTGVDLSSWGGDLPGTPPLGDLVRRILKFVPDLPRLRLSSIDPAEVDPVLFELITTDTRLTPYLHLSLQAGDDMILKRMKRRHSRGEAIDLCKRLKTARPEITFGADIIAGFPTETDEMFENSHSIISEIGIPWLHVFPFSARQGTPAAKIPPVPGNIVKARGKTLREAGMRERDLHLAARVGDIDIALFEQGGLAHLPDFSKLRVDNPPSAGTLAPVRITGVVGDTLQGQLDG